MKRMSFSATISQMYAGTKTVTRRAPDTWADLAAGDVVMAVEKAMGLKPGQRQRCIRGIEVIDVSLVSLLPLSASEIDAEGFPGMSAAEFVRCVWEPLHGRLQGGEMVRRIEFKHRPDVWVPGYLPSNGTTGQIFRSEWCANCVHDHGVHTNPYATAGEPGVCDIHTESMICYPGPGPRQWERRIVDSEPGGRSRFETRCTEFQQCARCDEPAKATPVDLSDRWRPRSLRPANGQQTLIL